MIPVICYLALILVSMAIATVVYTLVILGWCGSSFGEELERLSHIWLPHSSIQKGIEKAEAALLESKSCAVCACQDSKMGKMFASFPTASTSFRSPCIDTRLHSHSDCPLCRVPVTGWIIRQQTRTILLDIRILSWTSTPLHAIFFIQCSEEISICKAHQNLWKIKVIVVQNCKCNLVLENHKDNSLFNLSSFFSQYYTWFLIINML